MSKTRTINSIHKHPSSYSHSDVMEAMDEARTVLNDSIRKVWADDKYIREVAEGVIK